MKNKTTKCNHNFKIVRGEQRQYVYKKVCFDCGEVIDDGKNIEDINAKLIKEWNSIPWWKFWAKPSFEKKRNTIISNWENANIK